MNLIVIIVLFQGFDCMCVTNLTLSTEKNPALFNDLKYPKTGDIPLLNRKIFRGMRVTIMEHPYIVSIRREYSHYQTGALLTRNIVISVAHPLINIPINELGVVTGENYADRGTIMLTVLLLVVHEHFDPYTLYADLAMLRIYEDVVYRIFRKPIGIITDTVLAGKRGHVTGWGRCDWSGMELCLPRSSTYFPNERFDPMLRSISFLISSISQYCSEYQRQDVEIYPGMLCVGTARVEDLITPCMAVPGAPLVVNGRIVGLQSWGLGCGYSHDLPLIYTDLEYYKSWVHYNILSLRRLTKRNLTKLYLASKTFLMYKLLCKTRVVLPLLHEHSQMEIQAIDIDKQLAELRGTVYDFRDFIENKKYREAKIKIYNEYKLEMKHKKKHKILITAKKQNLSIPFLNKNATLIEDADLDDNSKFQIDKFKKSYTKDLNTNTNPVISGDSSEYSN